MREVSADEPMGLSPELLKTLGHPSIMVPSAELPSLVLPIEAFQAHLASVMEESRETLVPFSVLLLALKHEKPQSPAVLGSIVGHIGSYLVSSLRTSVNPHFPPRKLDVVSCWGHYFVAICFNTGPDAAIIPANRVFSKIERDFQQNADLRVRVVVWTWSWRDSVLNELAILRRLREEAEQDGETQPAPLPEQLSPLEARIQALLAQIGLDE